jgi:hypothetical protein
MMLPAFFVRFLASSYGKYFTLVVTIVAGWSALAPELMAGGHPEASQVVAEIVRLAGTVLLVLHASSSQLVSTAAQGPKKGTP